MKTHEEFYHVHVTQKKLDIDPEKTEREVVSVVLELVKQYPDIGALVFECSDIREEKETKKFESIISLKAFLAFIIWRSVIAAGQNIKFPIVTPVDEDTASNLLYRPKLSVDHA